MNFKMHLKIALMDMYKEGFTEGDNFNYYAEGFLEQGCRVFQLDPYTIDFKNSLGMAYRLTGNSADLKRQEQGDLTNLGDFDVVVDLSDLVDLGFAKKLSKVNVLHINPPLATYASADKKTYVRNYPEFIPKTVVSSSMSELERALYEDFGGVMVVKDPFGYCGKDIEKVIAEDPYYRSILKNFTKRGKKEVVAQEFLSLAYEGSKRVAVIGDIKDLHSYKILHVYGRKPSKGNWKDNLSQGGNVVDVNLRDDEKELCLNVAAKSGLYAVGLDIMDDIDSEGKRVPRLLETNAVLALAKGRYPFQLKKVPEFILNNLLKN